MKSIAPFLSSHAVLLSVMSILWPLAACDAQPQRLLLALSKADHTLSIVEPGTLKILARVPVGEDPHEVVAAPDGKTAYVAIYGGGAFHEINVIDLVNYKALPSIDTRPLYGPHDLAFIDGKVWFTAEGSKSVGRYDPAGNKLDWSMGTGQDRTHMLHVTPDARKIYTTNMASGTVSILTDSLIQPGPNAPPNAKPRRDWVQDVITVSRGSEGFDVMPDGKTLWTAASSDGAIWVIDLARKKVKTRIDAKAMGANRLKFTPDGKLAFVSSLSTGDVFIYDTKTMKEVKKVSVGRGAAGILADPDGTRVFVACSPDHSVAVIDTRTLEVTGRLDVGRVPDGLAWAKKP